MKIEDLMIGDLVRVAKDGVCIKKGTIVKVRFIDAENRFDEEGLLGACGCIDVTDRSNNGGVWAAYLEPIPLTKEILEKNGFKRCNGNQWSLYKYEDDDYTKKSLYQVFWSANDLYLEIASYTSKTGEYNRMGIQFVHQLQQAMRICGISKSIEV